MNQDTSTHDEFTLKEKLTYGIVSVVVLGGSFFIGRSLIRKARYVKRTEFALLITIMIIRLNK